MRKRSARTEEGMVTAEAAVVLPSLLLVLALAVTVIATLGAKLKVVDAAREAARIAARGDSVTDAKRAAVEIGPPGTRVTVTHRGEWVEVSVQATLKPLGVLPGYTVTARSTVVREGS